ncbi:MAG TPA: 30S ribosomal protein S20 [Planctomycetes bacterium]|nr:30S ribosomal protein S20 [Planctomycetota bacterium]
MAHTKSAKKRIRQNERDRLANKAKKSAMKTFTKKVLAAVAAGDLEGAKKVLPFAMKKIDKAAKTHVIHKNTAARKKSKVCRAVAALEKKQG